MVAAQMRVEFDVWNMMPTNQCFSFYRHGLPFDAFFAPSSDEEFTVIPSSGDLPPAGAEGTLIRIAYKPKIYGKTHKAKLVVQTPDMQWTYDVIGTTSDYNPPNARSKILSLSANSPRRSVKQKKNYVLENLKLQSTAVSSPLKGIRLVTRSARWKLRRDYQSC